MKNILLLCESYGGGVKTYIDTIFLRKSKFINCNFIFLVSSKRVGNSKINPEFIVNDNLSFGLSPFKFFKAILALNEIVRKYDIDIIHANSTFSGFLIYFYALFNKNLTLVYTPHGYYSFKPMTRIKKKVILCFEKEINKRFHKIIHVSKSEENQALKQGLLTKNKSVIIFNGVKDPKINILNNDKTARLTIINLARVEEQKNPFEFIKIAKFVLEHNPSVRFVWAGNGSLLNEAREKVLKLGLQESIRFIGHSDKYEILSEGDVFLSSSHYEGLPFSVIEAMSFKLPLILSNVVGHKDLVYNEENGMLFNNNDYEKITKFINLLVNNKDKYRYYSSNSYKIYKNLFSVEKMIENLNLVYNNLLEKV